MTRIVLLLVSVLTISACADRADRDIGLRDLRSFTGGPDEFSVLPSKPLQAPSDYATLPAPTPGAGNLTDQNPRADGIAALGGKPSALVPAGIPTSESALVTHTSRNGVDPTIRQTLATEDEEFRRFNSRFTRLKLFREDRYNRAYRRETIDPSIEQRRWQSIGVKVPSAPPHG